jgi:hypothetical protein
MSLPQVGHGHEASTDLISQLDHIHILELSIQLSMGTNLYAWRVQLLHMLLENAHASNPALVFASIAVQLRGESLSALSSGTNDAIRRECSFLHIPHSIHPRHYSFDKTSFASQPQHWAPHFISTPPSQLASSGGQGLIDRRLRLTTTTRSSGFNSSSNTQKGDLTTKQIPNLNSLRINASLLCT